MTIEIVEAKPWHCGQMARIMRRDHHELLAKSGANPHRLIKAHFDMSSWRRSGMIDGRLVGMGGICGSVLDATGFMWLVLSQEVHARPREVARVLRRLMDEIMETRQSLTTVVLPEDDAALRLAVFMGFGAGSGPGGIAASTPAGRRHLKKFLSEDTDLRRPAGAITCIQLGMNREGRPWA